MFDLLNPTSLKSTHLFINFLSESYAAAESLILLKVQESKSESFYKNPFLGMLLPMPAQFTLLGPQICGCCDDEK